MCGIAGTIGAFQEDVLREMSRALTHRGPDDEGYHVSRRVQLASRRLSIIDVEGGHQPLSNEAGDVQVVLNGEIYNHAEVRAALVKRGHRFCTRSDTEVIAHGYEEWGLEVVSRLRGMFAFALHDARGGTDRVVFSRDRLGIKPLYLARTESGWLFASEVRAILAAGLVPPRLSRAGLGSFLSFGSVQEPDTLVEGITSLPPATTVVVDGAGDHAKQETYWTHPPAGASQAQDPQAAVLRIRAALAESVRAHLESDVPVGIFLSSGVDSTLIAALAKEAGADLRTFTLRSEDPARDEGERARQIAARLESRHTESRVSDQEARRALPAFLAAMDQPTVDGFNTYLVSRAARASGLKVALTGLGGDEAFGGYASFRQVPPMIRVGPVLRATPSWARRAVARVIRTRASAARAKLAHYVEAPLDRPHPYFHARSLFTPRAAQGLNAGHASSGAWQARQRTDAASSLTMPPHHAVSYLETRHYLLNTLLRDADVFSMANSLEVRPPFVDHVLIERVFGLPERVIVGRTPKSLLHRAAGDLLAGTTPTDRKQTFTLAFDSWLRGGLGAEIKHDLRDLSPPLHDALDAGAVSRVWDDFEEGRTSWARPWALHALNRWARLHMVM